MKVKFNRPNMIKSFMEPKFGHHELAKLIELTHHHLCEQIVYYPIDSTLCLVMYYNKQ